MFLLPSQADYLFINKNQSSALKQFVIIKYRVDFNSIANNLNKTVQVYPSTDLINFLLNPKPGF